MFRRAGAHAAACLVAWMEDEALDRAPVWDDVKTFDGRAWCGKVDILTAGYPRQPFTASGLRREHLAAAYVWRTLIAAFGA